MAKARNGFEISVIISSFVLYILYQWLVNEIRMSTWCLSCIFYHQLKHISKYICSRQLKIIFHSIHLMIFQLEFIN